MTLHQSEVGSITKSFDEWFVTAGNRPEQVLERLDSYNIEWYVSGKGDLWVRYWQLGSEDFVPIERVAEIRAGRQAPADSDRLEWLSRNLPSLRANYAGQWVAMAGGEILAAADLPALLAQVEEHQLENPFITQIPAEEVVWTTTYARQVV